MGSILNAIINALAAVFGFLCGYVWYEDCAKNKRPKKEPQKAPEKPEAKTHKVYEDVWIPRDKRLKTINERITNLDKEISRAEFVAQFTRYNAFTDSVVKAMLNKDNTILVERDPFTNKPVAYIKMRGGLWYVATDTGLRVANRNFPQT